MSPQLSDIQLIDNVLAGDPKAFDVIMLRYQNKINRIIFRYVNDAAMAADLRQEVFIKVYLNLATFQRQSAFYTWLYRIAINTVKNYFKTNPNKYRYGDVDTMLGAEHWTGKYRFREYSTPENQLVSYEMQDAVINAFNHLPEELRESILMREINGMSYDDIAKHLEIPVGTVRSRIFRARSAIDDQIKPFL